MDEAPANLFVVGVGASAGGLEALAALVSDLTLDAMSLVVVQHLSPDYESALPTLLSRSARSIPVLAAADGMKVEPNHVYVIPPNADLGILNGVLQVISPPSLAHPRLPIDYFFRSLADDQGARAIGVVLSGTGSDGTLGLKRIKAAGGMTFAQEPSSAKYESMPRAALDSGCVDFSGTPAEIARELMFLGKHPYHTARGGPPRSRDGLSKILLLIRSTFGNDLSYYKITTVERRLERRMALHKIDTMEAYAKLVQSNPLELRALYKDMLIGVTNFFRDPEAFEALKALILPQIADVRRGGDPIRVWVPACSTGEEAYSLAIALLEVLEARKQESRIQIFATDVDEDSILEARRGRYPENIALDVSPERLSRFFVRQDDGYSVARRVRDVVVFSTHDVAKDPPFSRLDLVSCRNLLIYLQPVMQKKVLRIFHYALNPTGFLLLGSSESVGDAPDLFSVVDAKNKIYLPKTTALLSPIDLGVGVTAAPPSRTIQPGGRLRPIVNLAQMAERKVLDLFGPPGVVINENLDVLHFRGRTAPYLEPAPGAATLNVLRLARPEIHADLRRAIDEALSEDRHIKMECSISEAGQVRPFTLEVIPMPEPETRTRCLLVLFHAPERSERPPVAVLPRAEGVDQRSVELERELMLTKEYLQNTIEELEGTNEELQSANEELQSANEELQSTNEELETSKEEMQSGNEELTTVNEELNHRMAELQLTYDDLVNVMNGVDNAVVIVGLDLCIRRFTHAAEKTLGLSAGDVGRSIALVQSLGGGLRLGELATKVIDRLSTITEEVRGSDGRWYSLRVMPYKTVEHMIRGAVIVLVDIDARRRSTQLGQDIAGYASQFLSVIRDPLLIIDEQQRIRWANEAYYSSFHVVEQETVGQLLPQLGAGLWDDAGLAHRLEALSASGVPFRDLAIQVRSPDDRERSVMVSGSRVPPIMGERILILLSFASGGG